MSFIYSLIGLVLTGIPFAFALALPFILVAWGLWLYRSPIAGVVSVLLLFLFETLYVQLFSLNLGVHAYPQDLLFLPMALVAGLRLLKPGAMTRLPGVLWLLTGMLFLSFAIGLVQNGSRAGVEFRNEFYFLACLFYFSSFVWTSAQIDRLLNWIMVIALLVLCITWTRWLCDGLGLDWFERVWALNDETGVPLRVLSSFQTFVLGLALLILVYAMASGKTLTGWLFMVPLLGISILVLQHRSVWVAIFVPALMAFVIVRQNQGRLAGRMALILAASAVVLVPVLASGKFSSATDSVSDMANRATSTTGGTFVGRVNGWQSLLAQWKASGPRAWVLGSPYGSGYAREAGPGGQEVAYAPHNYYVQLLLRIGLPGLLFFLGFFWWLGRGAVRLAAAPHPGMNGYVMLGLLFALLLYYIPYSASYSHGLLLGVMLAIQLHSAPSVVRTERKSSSTRRNSLIWTPELHQ